MAQTVKELVIGLDLQKSCSQFTYYFPGMEEPVTLGPAPGKPVIPAALYRDRDGKWRFPDRPEEEPEKETKDGLFCVKDIYGRIERGEETLLPDGTKLSGPALFSLYLQACIRLLHMYQDPDTVIHLMVTVRRLTRTWSETIVKAWESLGRRRKNLYLQDHLASFFYYTINQRKSSWNQDTALLEYEDSCINGYVLHIDTGSHPSTAAVRLVASQRVEDSMKGDLTDQEWDKEKDRLFFELLKKVFERRNVAVSYLTGDYFQKSWAERSIQYLCYRRQAFQGQNLYSRGACFAAMERAGQIAERQILFCGDDMIPVNLGMEMRIRGKETYYPLVNAGINWYEAWHVCEFIPEGETQVRIFSQTAAQGEMVTHLLPLRHLKNRPDRTLRLRMVLYFIAPDRCRVELEDLGFGELAPSSGLRWERDICF